MSPESESARLQRLEDREAIKELLYAYGMLLDRGEYEAYAGLFTEDGEWSSAYADVKGRDAIRDMVANIHPDRQPLESVHVFTSPVITFVDADTATTNLNWSGMVAGPDGTPITDHLGRYEDKVVRDSDGKWRFAARRVFNDIPRANPRH